ncbi:hypothetical protein CYMTET_24275 [Cymbomonas tetramitiformis]|uniref:AAA+ ATPase domain-containing protein n=1 Tax=Cymbomonas tetramitiformis TaxID=36881 RepID=A0AAE0L024_9CHLO|nr:hypothetical protein CYMTET_24275 [Cymbomonas tetramitiformis]
MARLAPLVPFDWRPPRACGEGAAAGSGSGKELSEAASEVEARKKRKEASKKQGEELREAASEVEARQKRREASKRKGEELLERARVLELLRAAVLRCLAFEPEAAVRAVLANGEGLVAETAAAVAGPSGAEERGAVEDEARALAESQEERCGAWSATAGVVEQEMHTRLKALTELQLQAEKETDVLQKHELLVQCREAHAALAQASSNVKDVGSTLGVLVEFLSSVDTKLQSIGMQLDELQAGVRVLGEDIRRLVGRPVLEELQEKREQRAKQWEQLCDRVHIPIEGMKVDENGQFVLDKERSQAEEMLTLVTREFLQSEQKDVLLLSGPAGSGKSTFVRQLEHHLESVLAKEHTDMLLVMVSLPTLQNPVTNLFAEALRSKGLREAQIHELRDLAQRGEVRLVFLLDAYDELKPQFQFKNLYVTNSLEQYRARESPAVGDTPPGSSDEASGSRPKEPKVIITTRTELLAHDKHYWRHFVPVQVDVAKRDTEDEARWFYLELRIAPFGAKLEEYIAAKVALEVRQAFAKHYGELSPISKQTFEKSENMESDVADLFIGGSSDPLLAAAFQAVSTHEGRRIDGSCVKTLLHPLCEGANPYDKSEHRHALYRVAAVLSLALKTPPQDSQMKKFLTSFCDQLPPSKAEGGIWQAQDYEDALDSIPELRQLTTTPFMVKIVTEILPALFKGQDCDASIQTNLLRLLTEDAMQVVWRQICLWRNEVPNEPAGILAGVRGMWDSDESVTDQGSRGCKTSDVESLKAAFAKLVDRVAESLKAKDGMLLEQAPLVEMVKFQDRASKLALEDSHRANEPTERLPVATAQADAPSGEASQRVEGGNTMEEVICREVLPYVLQSALRRLPVRRAHVYDLFVSIYVAREAQKASTTAGALDTETVKRASEEFSQQLALRMGCENMSKVVIGSSDKLFQKGSVWDSFVRDTGELGALRMAARNAAPVQFQHGVLTFMHKTVQEYLCASGLRHILKQVLQEQAVSLEALFEQLRNEQLSAAEKRGASSITKRLLGKRAARPNKASKTRPADAGSRELDALTAAKALRQVEASLMASEWTQLDLRYEEAVRDFLTDIFLDNQEFVDEMHFLAVWAECSCRGGHLAGEEAHACDLLLQNARILLTGKLASRDGGTLLHVAAVDGSYSAVSQLLQLMPFVGGNSLLEQRDSKEHTPLECAKQHMQVAAALEVASMPRSVVEELQEQREQRAKQWEQLRDRVHIPIEGMQADENGEFVLDKQRSQAEDMLALVTREFLQSEQKDVLLLSGPAGSGKSTFVRQLEPYLENMLAKEYANVLLVMVSLPTLQNPVTDLFVEALRLKGLREAQIYELRDLVQAGEVRLVFLLDAYDELKPQFQFTNLYVSNSLEQFRRQDHAQDGKASPSPSWVGPKVIITSRTELLKRNKPYASSFVPLEMDNEDKCNENLAMGFFLELRIVSFENKLDAYMHAKVALEVQQAFQLRVGALVPVSEEAALGVFEAARKALGVSGDSEECECIKAVCLSVAVAGGGEVLPERLTQLNNNSMKLPTDGALPFYEMALVLATALKELPADLDKCLRAFAREQARLGQEERIWQHADYRQTFDGIPELQELTTTPFMVEIVTEILPQLDAMQSTDASIKAKLLLLLDERATQLTWRQICTWRSEHDADRAGQPAATRAPILQRVQEALDRPAEGDRGGAELKALEELSIRVGDVLKAKKLVLEQPKLVAIALAQTKRWRNVVDDWTDEAFDDAAVEEEICGKVMRYALRIALSRTKVRGSDIYRMFVARYVEREARKAAAGGPHTVDSVRREGREYAQRLALEMVSESVSKVPIASDSELFREESIWDPFLRGKGLLQAAQKAAPVLNDGTVLTFIHKTVQEYLCAAALRDILHRVFHNLAVPLKRLQEDLIQSTAEIMKLEQGHASEREQKGRGAGGPRSAQGVSAGVRVGPGGSTQEDAAMTEKALLRVEQGLLKSAWARVDLRREDVVREFLVDMFLDEPELVVEVHLLVTWVERRCKGGRLQRGEVCEGGMLPENVRAVLGGALPKRDGGTLLHEAASEGSYFAVSMALEMIDARLLEAVDADGRTPLFCAAQRGHAQVVAALRAAGAKHDTRSKLQPRLRLIAVVPFTKIPQTCFGQAFRAAQPLVRLERGLVSIGGKEFILEHGIIGAPEVAPFEGSWRFEVDVDLKWNFWHGSAAHKEMRDTLCLGFCVGWSAQDARHISWNNVTDSLDTVPGSAVQSWLQGLGFQLGTNHWSCGLRDSGVWNSPSGAVSHAECNSSKPSAAAHAPIDMKCTVAMLLDCHARKVHVSTGAKWVEHDVGDLGGCMFPAVSWMGCHGEVSFNFGERPWRCEVPTPGGDRFRPIREAGTGNTPVMEAASEGHLEVCSLLLDSNAAEDVGRRHQRTLLHWAAWWGDAEMVRQVLEVSGDLDACMRAIDGDGLNAVWHAADRGHAEVLRVLWETSLSLKGVSSAGMSSSTGADFNYVALEGRTPAHLAADGGFTEALRVLKGAGADLSHAANDGQTPAHGAADGGHVEVLRMLQDAGADLSHAANDGRMSGMCLFPARRLFPAPGAAVDSKWRPPERV